MFCKYVCVSVNVYVCMNVSCCWRCVIESFITCGLRDIYARKKLSFFFFLASLLKHFSPKKHVCLQNMNHATLLTAKEIVSLFLASADRMLLLGMFFIVFNQRAYHTTLHHCICPIDALEIRRRLSFYAFSAFL